jgi:hypothetical protein
MIDQLEMFDSRFEMLICLILNVKCFDLQFEMFSI